MDGFFRELWRGRVYRAAVSYAVMSWVVLQVAAIVIPALGLPSWTLPATIAALLCGFSAVLWVGWLQDHRRVETADGPAAVPHTKRHHLAFAAVSLLPALAVAAGFVLLRRPVPAAHPAGKAIPAPAGAGTPGVPVERAVAVLPFENLSDDQANAYFAEGIQDEILTDLSRVADLKVISRTSVMAYGSGRTRATNVRDIGRELGVSYVLEGSVQKAAGRVRVTAQLIDARSDTHLWAEHYDRDAADIFAIQSEIAERIAASLRARLSPDEKVAINARPTGDVAAYDLYLQAKELVLGYQETADWRGTLLRAVRLLDEAVGRDGRFVLAWCLAAKAHDQLYANRLDPTSTRLALEQNAVAHALDIAPALGEVRLARALLLYHGQRDYAGMRAELALAARALPNSAEVASLTSYVDRRQGNWAEALRQQTRALSLDPRNPTYLNDQVIIYDMLRMYREEVRACDAAIADAPASANYQRMLKASALLAAGRTAAARGELNRLPPDHDPGGATSYTRVCAALYDGHPDEAARVWSAFGGEQYPGINGVMTPRAWMEGLLARAAGDPDAARRAFARARGPAEAGVRERPEDAGSWSLLGMIDAGLGRKDDALREGRHACELLPVEADAMDGPSMAGALAMICAWTGEADEAMRLLRPLSNRPGGPDYGQLQYDPAWSDLRGRTDFQAMLATMDPKMN